MRIDSQLGHDSHLVLLCEEILSLSPGSGEEVEIKLSKNPPKPKPLNHHQPFHVRIKPTPLRSLQKPERKEYDKILARERT